MVAKPVTTWPLFVPVKVTDVDPDPTAVNCTFVLPSAVTGPTKFVVTTPGVENMTLWSTMFADKLGRPKTFMRNVLPWMPITAVGVVSKAQTACVTARIATSSTATGMRPRVEGADVIMAQKRGGDLVHQATWRATANLSQLEILSVAVD